MLPLLGFLIATAPTLDVGTKATQQSQEIPVPDGVVTLKNPRSLVAAMQDAGYKAKLESDNDEQFIKSATNGASFEVLLLNCKEKVGCQDLMFRSSYTKKEKEPATLENINEFNREKRWLRAYLDKEGDPVVEFDVLFTNQQVSKETFEAALDIWDDVLAQFHQAIKF